MNFRFFSGCKRLHLNAIIYFLGAASLCFASVAAASAHDRHITSFDPRHPVSSESKVTYLDLIRKVFTDAKSADDGDLTAASSVDLRQLSDGTIKKGYEGPMDLSLSDGYATASGKTVVL